MITRRTLSDSDAQEIIEAGEVPERIRASAANVAVVMSQDWCSQWVAMDSFVDAFSAEDQDGLDLVVYTLVYNRIDSYHQFRRFKEQVWGNYTIPYVRYYTSGRLTGESNYVSRSVFLTRVRGSPPGG